MMRRELAGELERMAGRPPVVTLADPRQSGKSTLVRAGFPGYEHVNLEDAEARRARGPRRLHTPAAGNLGFAVLKTKVIC